MMWFPARAAFRAGQVGGAGSAFWDTNNVGHGSVAFGENTRASGEYSVAAGMNSAALGNASVALGSSASASGSFSVAIGSYARTAGRTGAIVLGDGAASIASDSVYATANNQFVARGSGGIVFYTALDLTSGVSIAPGGSGWDMVSDRSRKENFQSIDGEDLLRRVLTVPVTSWNYTAQEPGIRHIGAMAQDFNAAFELGGSDRVINSVDMDGVNLAAVQALIRRTEELSAQNVELRARIARLEAWIEGVR